MRKVSSVTVIGVFMLGFIWQSVSRQARADEGGVSFWLPGQYGSFAAVASNPGWSFEAIYYRQSPSAQAGINFARGGGLQVGVKSPVDLVMFTPTYTFETPVFGAQLAIGMTAVMGKNSTSATATLIGPGGGTLSGAHSDSVTGFGDPSPTATLYWNKDDHYFMLYGTTGIPVGAYDINRMSALGLGHWAVDGGAGYTYFNEKAYSENAGVEWSVVAGLTYNFVNPYTDYRSGIDWHVDWSWSPYVSEKMLIGAVGYVYGQLTGDSAPNPIIGDSRSRVAGIGPQVAFFFPFADREATLSFKAYYEFDVHRRLDGWNGWITLQLDAPEKPARRSR
jgi:hypothetical protein